MTPPLGTASTNTPLWLRGFTETTEALRNPQLQVPRWPGANHQSLAHQLVSSMPSMHDRPERAAVLRPLVSLISPANVAGAQERTRTDTDRLLDAALQGAVGGEVDLVEDFTSLLSPTYLHRVLGLGDAIAPRQLRDFSRDLGLLLISDPSESEAAAQRCEPMIAALTVEIERRRGDTNTPLGSLSQGGATNLEVVAAVALIASGGQETVSSLAANLIVRLRADPRAKAAFASDPYAVVDEVVRLTPPIEVLARRAAAETQVARHSLDDGQTVLVDMRAALRDPSRFDCPDEFRVDRGGDPGLAFGMGAHRCPGRQAARLLAVAAALSVQRLWPDSIPVIACDGRPPVQVFAGPTRLLVLEPAGQSTHRSQGQGGSHGD